MKNEERGGGGKKKKKERGRKRKRNISKMEQKAPIFIHRKMTSLTNTWRTLSLISSNGRSGGYLIFFFFFLFFFFLFSFFFSFSFFFFFFSFSFSAFQFLQFFFFSFSVALDPILLFSPEINTSEKKGSQQRVEAY